MKRNDFREINGHQHDPNSKIRWRNGDKFFLSSFAMDEHKEENARATQWRCCSGGSFFIPPSRRCPGNEISDSLFASLTTPSVPQLSLEFPKMFEVRPSFSARKTHRGELNSGQVEVWELLPLEAYSYYVFLPIMVYKGWPARPRKGKCHVGWYLMSDWRPVT